MLLNENNCTLSVEASVWSGLAPGSRLDPSYFVLSGILSGWIDCPDTHIECYEPWTP